MRLLQNATSTNAFNNNSNNGGNGRGNGSGSGSSIVIDIIMNTRKKVLSLITIVIEK